MQFEASHFSQILAKYVKTTTKEKIRKICRNKITSNSTPVFFNFVNLFYDIVKVTVNTTVANKCLLLKSKANRKKNYMP